VEFYSGFQIPLNELSERPLILIRMKGSRLVCENVATALQAEHVEQPHTVEMGDAHTSRLAL
jgi:hypothetical protein